MSDYSPKDILLDENFDPLIFNGDLVVGDATEQNLHYLMLADKGAYRARPWLGAGILDLVNGTEPNVGKFLAKAQKQVEADGARVTSLDFDTRRAKLNLSAYYLEPETE